MGNVLGKDNLLGDEEGTTRPSHDNGNTDETNSKSGCPTTTTNNVINHEEIPLPSSTGCPPTVIAPTTTKERKSNAPVVADTPHSPNLHPISADTTDNTCTETGYNAGVGDTDNPNLKNPPRKEVEPTTTTAATRARTIMTADGIDPSIAIVTPEKSQGVETTATEESNGSIITTESEKVFGYVKELVSFRKFKDLSVDEVDTMLVEEITQNPMVIPYYLCWIKVGGEADYYYYGNIRFLLSKMVPIFHHLIGISSKGFFWNEQYYTSLAELINDFKKLHRQGQRKSANIKGKKVVRPRNGPEPLKPGLVRKQKTSLNSSLECRLTVQNVSSSTGIFTRSDNKREITQEESGNEPPRKRAKKLTTPSLLNKTVRMLNMAMMQCLGITAVAASTTGTSLYTTTTLGNILSKKKDSTAEQIFNRYSLHLMFPKCLAKNDIWIKIFSFLGPGHYVFVAGVCKDFKKLYWLYFSTLKDDQIPMVKKDEEELDDDNYDDYHFEDEDEDDSDFDDYGILPSAYFEKKAIATNTFYSAIFYSVDCAKFWDIDTQGSDDDRLEDDQICRTVAKYGNLDVLKWARHQKGCPWDRNTSWEAARSGRLDMVQYAHKNGCPWDSETCNQAAQAGRLAILQYAHENGCPWDAWTCWLAARRGHFMTVRYAHEKGCPWDSSVCSGAAEIGRLDILQYAHDNGCPWDKLVCSLASYGGHLRMLQYAHENGCPWDSDTCKNASAIGRLDILRYAHENGCPWDSDTCKNAAKIGRLDILQYAHENGCPWEAGTCRKTAQIGRLDILQYARANGCPWDPSTRTAAIEKGHYGIARWAGDNGCPFDWRHLESLNQALLNR